MFRLDICRVEGLIYRIVPTVWYDVKLGRKKKFECTKEIFLYNIFINIYMNNN